jgi:hypothetical protein
MTPVQNCGSFTLQQFSLCCRRSQKSASSGDFGTACSLVRLPANFIRHFLAAPRLRCASVILGTYSETRYRWDWNLVVGMIVLAEPSTDERERKKMTSTIALLRIQ